MTTTPTSSPERARREADLWARQPDLTLAEVVATVAAEMEAEAVEAQERHAQAQQMSDAFAAMLTCQVCGQPIALGAPDGFCPPCRPVVARLLAERAAEELVAGVSRRDLAERFVMMHDGQTQGVRR